MKNSVSLLGLKLEVYGFPHIAQDTETHTCAESTLWTIFEYLGSRYSQYQPLLPSQILQNLSIAAAHKMLPSSGLTHDEIAKCLYSNGCECIIDYPNRDTEIKDFTLSILKIYIESGIPILLILNDDIGPDHAILAIGHEIIEEKYMNSRLRKKLWVDVSCFKKQLVFIDDNRPPYQVRKIDNPTEYNKKYRISCFFAPLPKHTNLDARSAFGLMEVTFSDKKVGLKNFGDKWFTRLFLTGSNSFKNFLLLHSGLDEDRKGKLLHKPFPKFIWICEVYRPEGYLKNYCSGLMIMDATGYFSVTSILWYSIDNWLIEQNGIGWSGMKSTKEPFKMTTYKNNLKGEWNGWKI
jgi:hypothetical protein